MVQPDMQLDRPLGRSGIGPREDREAQLDGGGIERIQRVVETKLVAGRVPWQRRNSFSNSASYSVYGLSRLMRARLERDNSTSPK